MTFYPSICGANILRAFLITLALEVSFSRGPTIADDCQSATAPIITAGTNEFQLPLDDDLWKAFLARLSSDSEQREQANLQARIQRNGDGDIVALSLSDFQLTTRELNALVSWAPHTRRLDLSGVDLTTIDLTCLSHFADLQCLGLGRLPASEVDLDWLSPDIALTSLNLHNATNADIVLERIAGMQTLAYIGLHGTDVTDDGIACLRGLPNLRVIDLTFAESITDDSVPHILTLPSLEFLYAQCSGISHAGANSISRANQGIDVYIHENSP